MLTAWRAGATAVKLFPAATGGSRHLSDLRGPFPQIPMLPTGGVGIDDIAAYLRAGAVGVGLGSPLLGDALTSGEVAGVTDRARRALRAVAAARTEAR